MFGKKTSGGATKNENMSNKELVEELKKNSTIICYRQYLAWWSCWYEIDKYIW